MTFIRLVSARNRWTSYSFNQVFDKINRWDSVTTFINPDIEQITSRSDKENILVISYPIFNRYFSRKTKSLSLELWEKEYRLIDIGFYDITTKSPSSRSLTLIYAKDGSVVDKKLFPTISE